MDGIPEVFHLNVKGFYLSFGRYLVRLGNPLDTQGYKVTCIGAGIMGYSWATLF